MTIVLPVAAVGLDVEALVRNGYGNPTRDLAGPEPGAASRRTYWSWRWWYERADRLVKAKSEPEISSLETSLRARQAGPRSLQ